MSAALKNVKGSYLLLRKRFSGLEPSIYFPLLLATFFFWLFISVTEEVLEGESLYLDRVIIELMHSEKKSASFLGSEWFQQMVRDITALGGHIVLGIITVAVVLYLYLIKNAETAIFVFFTIIGGQVCSYALKLVIARPRPEIIDPLVYTSSPSFPSGHASMAAVVYLTIGIILSTYQAERHLKIFFLSLVLFLTISIGLSRIYLGVHYPTDVAAGITFGLGWALLVWSAFRWRTLRRSLHLSPPENPENDS